MNNTNNTVEAVTLWLKPMLVFLQYKLPKFIKNYTTATITEINTIIYY